MLDKQLLVSSAVQVALFQEILLPEITSGFWKNERPMNHAASWIDVQILITETDELGAVNFTVPRLYNFVNPEFLRLHKKRFIEVAQGVKSNINFSSIRKELIELSCIIGGRLLNKKETPVKANRGVKAKKVIEPMPSRTLTKTAKKTVKKNPNFIKKVPRSQKLNPLDEYFSHHNLKNRFKE